MQNRFGVSLVEVIVVIAVIGILLSVIAVSLMSSRETTRSLLCKNNLRQIGLATLSFSAAQKSLPYSRVGRPQYLGLARLLPLMEHASVLDQLNATPPNQKSEFPAPAIFRCPDDLQYDPYPWVNYIPCGGRTYQTEKAKTAGYYQVQAEKDVRDGLSNTVFYSERMTVGYEWPAELEVPKRNSTLVTEFFASEAEFDSNCLHNFQSRDPSFFGPSPLAIVMAQYPFGTKYTPNGPSCIARHSGLYAPELAIDEFESMTVSSLHNGACQVAFGDGAIRSMSEDVSASVWQSLGTAAGDEVSIIE